MFGDNFRSSHDLYVLEGTDIMRGNLMLITTGA